MLACVCIAMGLFFSIPGLSSLCGGEIDEEREREKFHPFPYFYPTMHRPIRRPNKGGRGSGDKSGHGALLEVSKSLETKPSLQLYHFCRGTCKTLSLVNPPCVRARGRGSPPKDHRARTRGLSESARARSALFFAFLVRSLEKKRKKGLLEGHTDGVWR